MSIYGHGYMSEYYTENNINSIISIINNESLYIESAINGIEILKENWAEILNEGKTWDTIKEKIKAAFDKILEVLKTIGQKIIDFFKWIGNAITGKTKKATNQKIKSQGLAENEKIDVIQDISNLKKVDPNNDADIPEATAYGGRLRLVAYDIVANAEINGSKITGLEKITGCFDQLINQITSYEMSNITDIDNWKEKGKKLNEYIESFKEVSIKVDNTHPLSFNELSNADVFIMKNANKIADCIKKSKDIISKLTKKIEKVREEYIKDNPNDMGSDFYRRAKEDKNDTLKDFADSILPEKARNQIKAYSKVTSSLVSFANDMIAIGRSYAKFENELNDKCNKYVNNHTNN